MVVAINTGIFWGNFDPPTLAHQAIIYRMSELFTENFIIVKNNSNENYFASIEHRLSMLDSILPSKTNQYKILVQDLVDSNNYFDIHAKISGNLNVVVGMDALSKWLQQHHTSELIKYDGVYVVPRNTNSFIDITGLIKIKILLIDNIYKDISSTVVRAALIRQEKNNHSIALDNKVLQYINDFKLYIHYT